MSGSCFTTLTVVLVSDVSSYPPSLRSRGIQFPPCFAPHGDLVGIYMLQIPAYPEVILTGDLVGLYMLQIPAYPEVILT